MSVKVIKFKTLEGYAITTVAENLVVIQKENDLGQVLVLGHPHTVSPEVAKGVSDSLISLADDARITLYD